MNKKEFCEKYRNDVFSIVLKKVKNRAIAEDLTQEIFLKLIKKFSKSGEIEKIKNFGAYVVRTAQNHCKDYFKKKKFDSLSTEIEDTNELIQPEKRLIYKELENQSNIERLKTIDPEKLKGLERSIDFILMIHEFKRNNRGYNESNIPYLKAKTILYEAYKTIEKIFSPPSKDEILKTYELLKPRIKYDKTFIKILDPMDKFEFLRRHFETYSIDPNSLKMFFLDKKFKKYPKELSELNYRYFLYQDNKDLLDSMKYKLIKSIRELDKKIKIESSYLKDLILPNGFEFFLKNTSIIKAELPTLIFRVWKRALKKDKLIKDLLLEFKEEYRKTMWTPLFASLNESFNIETWRKKIYRKYKNKEFYEKLTNYIYEKSFVEKISPYWWRDKKVLKK